MSVPVDWKSERAVQAKIRGTKRNILPVDWKPERAVQAKVRDFHKQKQTVTAEAYLGKNTLCPFTNGDFSRTFDRQWAGFLRGIGCHRVPGFIPPMARFVRNNINSMQVCRVFVLRCQSASNLTCPVLFRRVTCHMQFTWSFKSQSYVHTCMHSCLQTSILSYIHTFKRAQRTHTHTILIHTWLHQSPRVLLCHISSIQPSILPRG